MEANELRIGNYVILKAKDSTIEWDVLWFELLSDETCDISEFAPIQLDAEWLVKFGFEKTHGAFLYDIYKILIDLDGQPWRSSSSEFTVNENCTHAFLNGEWLRKIEFVHQLQNLYFSITGKELTIK